MICRKHVFLLQKRNFVAMDCLKKYALSEKVVMTVLAYLKGWGFWGYFKKKSTLKKYRVQDIIFLSFMLGKDKKIYCF